MPPIVNIKDNNHWSKNLLKNVWSEVHRSPENFTDLVFNCSDGNISTHLGLLKMSCKTIEKIVATLDGQIQDDQITFIIPDFDIRTVQKFLEMIYTGKTGLEQLTDLDNITQFANRHLGFFLSLQVNVNIEKTIGSFNDTVEIIDVEEEDQSQTNQTLHDSGLETSSSDNCPTDLEDIVEVVKETSTANNKSKEKYQEKGNDDFDVIELDESQCTESPTVNPSTSSSDSATANKNQPKATPLISNQKEPPAFEIIDIDDSAEDKDDDGDECEVIDLDETINTEEIGINSSPSNKNSSEPISTSKSLEQISNDLSDSNKATNQMKSKDSGLENKSTNEEELIEIIEIDEISSARADKPKSKNVEVAVSNKRPLQDENANENIAEKRSRMESGSNDVIVLDSDSDDNDSNELILANPTATIEQTVNLLESEKSNVTHLSMPPIEKDLIDTTTTTTSTAVRSSNPEENISAITITTTASEDENISAKSLTTQVFMTTVYMENIETSLKEIKKEKVRESKKKRLGKVLGSPANFELIEGNRHGYTTRNNTVKDKEKNRNSKNKIEQKSSKHKETSNKKKEKSNRNKDKSKNKSFDKVQKPKPKRYQRSI